MEEITNWLIEKDIKIAAIQETKLTNKSQIGQPAPFTLIREDRNINKGGGLAFLIHESIQFTRLDKPSLNDDTLEYLAIQVEDLKLINVYIPPGSSCSAGYKPSLNSVFPDGDAIIMGDLNAHDNLWHSSIQDARGADLADEIGSSNFGTLNTEHHTRLPTSNGQATSPDVTLASLSILPYASWQAHTNLGSDHLPLIISLDTDMTHQPSEDKVYINFRKANWTKFKAETENKFKDLLPPTDVHKAEKVFRKILNNTSNTCIPKGRIKDIIPEIPTEAAMKIKERDNLRATQPHSDRITTLNQEIKNDIQQHKREKWRAAVSEIEGNRNSAKLFKLINRLNGKQKANSNQSIRFKGKYLSCPKKIAKGFNKQYSSVVPHKSSKISRIVTNKLKANKASAPATFTTEQTMAAVKQLKASKALGPDKISNLHLKHLGPLALGYLTKIFDLSIATSQIPDIWKSSTIIPLLKPNKPAEESSSYRPVSLLCPGIKLMERLLLPTLQENLEVPDVQHGFRGQHSTVTALHDFNQAVSGGFNEKKPAKRTVLLQLDLSKAFDMVSHDKLLDDLNDSTLPPEYKRWFNCYLHGRQSRVNFRGQLSTSRNVRTGVPQGAVTSPILFNFYVSKLPSPPNGVKVIQYADDMSVYAVGNDITKLSTAITDYTKHLTAFLQERELLVSAEKSTVTLFTPSSHEFKIHPQVYVGDTLVRLEQTPKLLGVYFDTMHTFSKHAKETAGKAKKTINILKALAGTAWGQEKEVINSTYKAITRSVLEYAVPIWGPAISDTNWERLQAIQNQGLRVASGCFKMAAVDHLHQETKILPLRTHSEMLNKQFIAQCHLDGHPGQKHLRLPSPPRKMKATVLSLEPEVNRLLPNQPSKEDYKASIKHIHTATVEETLLNYAPNKVLQGAPPKVCDSEKILCRKVRSTLSQLRSGYCNLLFSYKNRLDENIPNQCPSCSESPHDTLHLFNCRNNPTNLTVRDLWTNPTAAAFFLRLDDQEDATV